MPVRVVNTKQVGNEGTCSSRLACAAGASEHHCPGILVRLQHALETGDHTLLTNHSVEVKGSVLGVQARVLRLLFFRLCHYVLGRFFSTIVMLT